MMNRARGNKWKTLAAGAVTCVLAGSTAMVPVVAASAVPRVVAAPSAVFGIPAWSPLRAPARVSCVRTNCPGPYHGDWAIDFIDTDHTTFEAVHAAAPGIVHIGLLTGKDVCTRPVTYGTWVWIDHGNGRSTRYTHLQDVLVTEGQRVTPRTRLGSMGHNGNGPPCPTNYLHMEFRVNNVKVPPPAMSACVGAARVTMPMSLGYADWDLVPTNLRPTKTPKPNVFTHRSTNACMP